MPWLSLQFGRFTWWFAHDGNGPALIQAICAAITVGITAVLAKMTWRYVQLTQELSRSAQQQLKISVQPNIALGISLKWRPLSVGEELRAHISITNKGAHPVRLTNVKVTWQVGATDEYEERPINWLRNRVISPGPEPFQDDIALFTKANSRVEHMDSFSDFIYLTVECTDLASLSPGTFHYQPVSGLAYRADDPMS